MTNSSVPVKKKENEGGQLGCGFSTLDIFFQPQFFQGIFQADNAHGIPVLDHGNAVDPLEQHQLHCMGQSVFRRDGMIQANLGCERHQNGFDFARFHDRRPPVLKGEAGLAACLPVHADDGRAIRRKINPNAGYSHSRHTGERHKEYISPAAIPPATVQNILFCSAWR